MKRQRNKPGFTMMEMMIVIGIIMIFAAMAMPAFTKLMQGNKTGAAKNMIQSLMAVAQAHAAKNQTYAGIRFQFDAKNGVSTGNYNLDWQTGKQYMILVETATSGATIIFHAVPNTKPYALPEGIAVVSGDVINNNDLSDSLSTHTVPPFIGGMMDATTFTILFTPTGQMIVKNVSLKPHRPIWDGYNWIPDKIINIIERVQLPASDVESSMFYYDYYLQNNYDNDFPSIHYSVDWCRDESSTIGFYICEGENLRQAGAGVRWTNYVSQLRPYLVNQYTGAMIDMEEFQ